MRNILRSAARGKRLFLFLDYDGTLVPIRKTPELAILRPSRRRILERLSREAFVGIVSGRSLADIRRLVAIPGLAYIGNHGFEISYGRRHWLHPETTKIQKALKDVLKGIRRRTKGFAGVLLEDKGVTASVHYRLLAAVQFPKLREIVEREIRRRHRELTLTEGKKVLEIRPKVKWGKGRGVLALCPWFHSEKDALRMYIGDDQTDEDAFKALARGGITILVGRQRQTHARHRLADVNAVWRLLKTLAMTLDVPASARERKSGRNERRRPAGRPLRTSLTLTDHRRCDR
jgi:trehalose 6-phosphate phosphatase